MADQQQSWATICGGTLPELNVRRLQIGDRFVQTADLRVATERCFLADDRSMCAEKRVEGSRGKLYRCDGAVLDIKSKAKETIVSACWQSSTQEWRSLTNIRYALGVPRMQVQELCGPRLPSSLIRIQI